MSIPVVRFELEGMRQTLCMAITDHFLQQNLMIKEEVARVCTQEHIQMLIGKAIEKILPELIEEAVAEALHGADIQETLRAALEKDFTTAISKRKK